MIQIFYFSGSGNTELLAHKLSGKLKAEGETVSIYAIKKSTEPFPEAPERLVLLFPVYAFDAPLVVRRFLKRLPESPAGVRSRASIILTPCDPHWINSSAACGSRRILEKKGYEIVREEMVIMPSNFVVQYPETLSISLLEAAVNRAGTLAGDIVRDLPARLKVHPLAHLVRFLFRIEHLGDNLFGKDLRADGSCGGCGRCVEACPAGNIRMKKGRIVFGWHCILCMNCIYRCPAGAVHPRLYRFVPLRGGYNPRRLLERSRSGESPGGAVDALIPARFGEYLSGGGATPSRNER